MNSVDDAFTNFRARYLDHVSGLERQIAEAREEVRIRHMGLVIRMDRLT